MLRVAKKHTEDFRQEAIRIALTSGLPRRQAAEDLNVGFSTLAKWIQKSRESEDIPPAADIDLAKENARLRKENRLLLEEREILKKATVHRTAGNCEANTESFLRGSKQVKFSFVEEYRKHIPADRLCHTLGVTSRGFRAWRARPISQRQRDDMILLAHIREQHHLSLGSYGRPRMTQELKEIGLTVGHRRVGRLMRNNGINVVRTRKYKATTNSNHKFNIAPNLLDRNFHASQTNQKWAGDITYIWTREGWLYLAVMIDLHSRRIVGWAVSNRLKQDLALQALNRAVALRNPSAGLIHHTDRGSQYCSHDYQKRLRQLSFKASMSGKGNCYDNAVVEAFFKTLKAELIWRSKWQSREDVTKALFKYINRCLTSDVYIAEKGLLQ